MMYQLTEEEACILKDSACWKEWPLQDYLFYQLEQKNFFSQYEYFKRAIKRTTGLEWVPKHEPNLSIKGYMRGTIIQPDLTQAMGEEAPANPYRSLRSDVIQELVRFGMSSKRGQIALFVCIPEFDDGVIILDLHRVYGDIRENIVLRYPILQINSFMGSPRLGIRHDLEQKAQMVEDKITERISLDGNELNLHG